MPLTIEKAVDGWNSCEAIMLEPFQLFYAEYSFAYHFDCMFTFKALYKTKEREKSFHDDDQEQEKEYAATSKRSYACTLLSHDLYVNKAGRKKNLEMG